MSKCSANLRFEEQQKRPSKLSHAARDAPLDAVRGIVHRKLREDEDENPGIDAANTLTETAETGTRLVETAHRSKAHRKADTVNSPKWQQKQAIKKEYASPKAGKPGTGAASTAPSAAKKAEKAAEKAKAFLAKNKKGLILIGILGLLAVFLLNTASSCSVFVEGGLSAIGISTYPSKDDAMLGAEEIGRAHV